MMQNGHHSTVQSTIQEIFEPIESEPAEVVKQTAAQKSLAARLAIEKHFEEKELREQLKDYTFDEIK